jgi:phage terminase small subunit
VDRQIYDSDIEMCVAAYCIMFARYLDAEEYIMQHGGLLPNGKVSPWLRIANASFDRMLRLAAELGLTSVGRKRAVKVKSAAALNPFLK